MRNYQDQPLLLTVNEAAEALAISPAHAWRLVYRGALPSVRLGACVRIPRKALERYLEQLTEETP